MVSTPLPTPPEYAGQWVGLHDGMIVAASPDPGALVTQIAHRAVPCVVYRVPSTATPQDTAPGRPTAIDLR